MLYRTMFAIVYTCIYNSIHNNKFLCCVYRHVTDLSFLILSLPFYTTLTKKILFVRTVFAIVYHWGNSFVKLKDQQQRISQWRETIGRLFPIREHCSTVTYKHLYLKSTEHIFKNRKRIWMVYDYKIGN